MKRYQLPLTVALIFVMACVGKAEEGKMRLFEMRTYYAAEGKLEALHSRFRDHTVGLFERHGMTNIGYWTPVDNPQRQLVYLLAYPDRKARTAAWKAFFADPQWKAAFQASEVDGKLVERVESLFLEATDYSPQIQSSDLSPRIFELRTYTTTKGNLPALHQRFRDHTVALFAKHGMTNVGYWSPQPDQPGAENTLIYILAHRDQEAAAASFSAFRQDPQWIKARTESEAAVGGSLTAPDGVQSTFMQATDYSDIR